MSKPIGIALLGSGIVGEGVLNILDTQADRLADRYGIRFDVRHVVVRDSTKARNFVKPHPLSTDAEKAIDDPSVDVVIELMGGTGRAGELVERALKLGKPVITANKSLLSVRGGELFSLARKHKTCIAFEASCGGGIPIIDALLRGLGANDIRALVGIVNGTCNYILTRMTKERLAYADALKEAQKAGFAEADPTLDVSGRDAAQKLSLLAGLAFGTTFAEKDMLIEGIDTLDARDIDLAKELGYVIKLLAIAQRDASGAVSLRVHPTLVHDSDVLAEVSGSFNAISVWGHALGHALFYGRGAGSSPTASAVVADLISVGIGVAPILFEKLNVFPDAPRPVKLLPREQIRSRYYLRLRARDLPGTMARITDALGRKQISLSAVLQHESLDGDGFVPIVITTHLASEGAVREAIAELDALDVVKKPTVCLRIIDQPKEFQD
jgi:homoserine dehydrogenase